MTQHTFRKKAAIILLFISLISGAVRPSPSVPGSAPPMRSMGIRLNITGPSSTRYFKGSSLTMLSNSSARQMLSMILQSSDGSLVVIDGGWAMDARQLTQVLSDHGGRVSAWFLTHPHSDHVGAFIDIVNNPDSPITIDQVYYGLTNQAWYDEKESGRAPLVQKLRDALSKFPPEKLHNHTPKGTVLQFGGITAQIMNDMYLLDEDAINNSSIVVKFTMDDVTLMVLGDMGPEGGRRLLAEHTPEELQSDMVQMAHHGQAGVEKDVYAAINPKVCLWPTPRWLWNNNNGHGINSGPWHTLDTRRWMDELGVTTHYSSKDGDWVIQ